MFQSCFCFKLDRFTAKLYQENIHPARKPNSYLEKISRFPEVKEKLKQTSQSILLLNTKYPPSSSFSTSPFSHPTKNNKCERG